MKLIKLATFFLFIVGNCCSQDYFQLGIDYFNKNNYVMADSFLSIYVKQHPNDNNALFNRGVVRLYLRDTCSFCIDLFKINYPYEIDKQALSLYFKYCGKTDTIYFDKNFVESDKVNSRFFEVIEYHNYLNQTFGKIHDKKRKFNGTRVNLHQITSFKTDIFAFYELDSVGKKYYKISDTPPSFPGGEIAFKKSLNKNSYFQEAKTKLGLQGVLVTVELTIDRFGEIKSSKIHKVNPQISKIDELSKYIELIFKSLPNFNSGKLKGQNVEFRTFLNVRF